MLPCGGQCALMYVIPLTWDKSHCAFRCHIKAFSPKRGLIFTVSGALAPPPPPPPKFPVHTPGSPPWKTPRPLGFSAKPPPPPRRKGGGGEGPGVGGGGAEAPFTAKTSPLFGENAFVVIQITHPFSFLPPLLATLFLPFSRHLFALFSPSKSALFCRAKGTAQSLERGAV